MLTYDSKYLKYGWGESSLFISFLFSSNSPISLEESCQIMVRLEIFMTTEAEVVATEYRHACFCIRAATLLDTSHPHFMCLERMWKCGERKKGNGTYFVHSHGNNGLMQSLSNNKFTFSPCLMQLSNCTHVLFGDPIRLYYTHKNLENNLCPFLGFTSNNFFIELYVF